MSDLIDRQAAIDGKICIRRSNGVEIYDDYVVPVEYLEQLPPANTSEIPNSSDTISRKAAIDAIEKCHKQCCREDATGDEWIHYETTLNEVESILPAQPERIKGHWIEHDDCLTACECSVCHEKYNLYEEDVFGRNFCPNCGADMRGEDNETD